MPSTKPPSPPVIWLPRNYPAVCRHDLDLYQRALAGFVPPDAFDAHAHLYTVRGLNLGVETSDEDARAEQGIDAFRRSLACWMGDDCPKDGLFFAAPVNNRVDVAGENRFVAAEVADRPQSRAMMLIRPTDDPAAVESELLAGGFSGFKAYHLFAQASDTYQAAIDAFLPDWAWELADRHGLAIMLHMVRRRALSDPDNQGYIREHCRRYPHAKLVLAHAARGFCAQHTIDAIETLGGLENVYFDTAAICESGALEAVLRVFGPSRLMFGTDWPISNVRGRCVSVGDGFFWMYEHTVDFESAPFCRPTLVGIESLLALRQAARTCALTDSDVERIFRGTAREVLD
ncbi:MAG TPA: amidohydrolase family protein [Thermoguttaceae bacterium]|nr:amidohydrolase family protein [Thermoguttaceae bacterium]